MALYVKFECKTCENENCTGHGLSTTIKVCDDYKHTLTNADRFRAMSDEELADEIYAWHLLTACKSREWIINWLKEEVQT